MKRLFAAVRTRGPRWGRTRALEEQEGWLAHAAFTDGLQRGGLILLGGPLESSGDALLIFHATDGAEVSTGLAGYPSGKDMPLLRRIVSWALRLGERRLPVEFK